VERTSVGNRMDPRVARAVLLVECLMYEIDQLLAAPPSREAGSRILTWCEGLQDRIERGEMMIGLLSIAEVERVPDALRHAAACGHPHAWLLLGSWFMNPPIDETDFIAADRAFVRAVAGGVPSAGMMLARVRWFRRHEDLDERDQAEAYGLVLATIEREPEAADALYLLGLMTDAGFGVRADRAHACRLLERAADLGNSDAHFELYIFYSTGGGVPVDETRAFAHNRIAADTGNTRAAYNMGAFYATGRYVEQDSVQATAWYRRACDAGHGRACATLAAMFATGDGVEPDRDQAAQLFEQAESAGFDPSGIQDAIGWVTNHGLFLEGDTVEALADHSPFVAEALGASTWPPEGYDGAEQDAELAMQISALLANAKESSDIDCPYFAFVLHPDGELQGDEHDHIDENLAEARALIEKAELLLGTYEIENDADENQGDHQPSNGDREDSVHVEDEDEDEDSDESGESDPRYLFINTDPTDLAEKQASGDDWWKEFWDEAEYIARTRAGQLMSRSLTDVFHWTANVGEQWHIAYYQGTSSSGATVGVLSVRLDD